MKLRKTGANRLEMRDVFDAVNAASHIPDNKSIWIGVFDNAMSMVPKIRDINIKRSTITDWKVTFRENISGWGGDNEDK